MLQSRLGSFEGLEVADPFAGTGALGLEALSRGAARCTFAETDRLALETLKRNAAAGRGDRADIRSLDGTRLSGGPFHLVLMDPPYGSGLGSRALAHMIQAAALAPGALISLETARTDQPDLLRLRTPRRAQLRQGPPPPPALARLTPKCRPGQPAFRRFMLVPPRFEAISEARCSRTGTAQANRLRAVIPVAVIHAGLAFVLLRGLAGGGTFEEAEALKLSACPPRRSSPSSAAASPPPARPRAELLRQADPRPEAPLPPI
jgi:16S rRNA G966 N2-methylase RsmD